jgi:hypothetical protein
MINSFTGNPAYIKTSYKMWCHVKRKRDQQAPGDRHVREDAILEVDHSHSNPSHSIP